MRNFVMGDIHGAFKAFQQCLRRANFDINQDHLIQLGDIVDGYPEVYECIELLLSIKHRTLIKGNHDDWFQSFFETNYHPAKWKYGGKGTMLSYLYHAGKPVTLQPRNSGFTSGLKSTDIPTRHQQLLYEQKPFYVDPENRCFVHGGFDRHVPFVLQNPDIFFWDRDLFESALQMDTYTNGAIPEGFYNDTKFKEIFIGHTPTTNWNSDQPIKALNITNLDTGAGHQGRLTIMELGLSDKNPNSFWQSDPMLELYEHSNR